MIFSRALLGPSRYHSDRPRIEGRPLYYSSGPRTVQKPDRSGTGTTADVSRQLLFRWFANRAVSTSWERSAAVLSAQISGGRSLDSEGKYDRFGIEKNATAKTAVLAVSKKNLSSAER